MSGWFVEGILARVRGVVALLVVGVWAVVVGGVVRFISYSLRLGNKGENTLWWIAIGVTLWGIFRVFKASTARSRAEIASLGGASKAELDVVWNTRPDMRAAIVRETALRMFRQRLTVASQAELDGLAKHSSDASDEVRAELQRRSQRAGPTAATIA
jgi:hypothetical protein